MAATVSVLRGWALSAVFVLAGLFSGMATAAERAQFNALGYSQDERYFAFEQFGIQDGSGFPYSEIFIIDLDSDSFAGGSPFEVMLDDFDATLADARADAQAMAQSSLQDFDISRPAVPIALRADGEPGSDGLSLSYGIPAFDFSTPEATYTLGLELYKAPSSQDCSFFEGDPIGFALLRESEGETVEIHRDKHVPASRGCVVTYKFYGLLLPFQSYDNGAAVGVLSVWSHGFEGPDRRFIALPVGDQ